MTNSPRAQRLERAGIPPLFGREFRSLVPSKPRGPEAARSLIDADRAGVRALTRDDASDDGPLIEGTGTVYDVWYTLGRFMPFREKFAPGAFKKSLADGADIRSMFNHDPSRLLGRTKAGTLETWEDNSALHYRVSINPDDPLAMSAHAQVLRGDVDGSSIWFSIVREEWTFADEDNGLEMDEVVVQEAKLFEEGPVTFPANEAAESSARSLDVFMQGLGVDDDDERREMVLEALADPERAVDTLKRALGVTEIPDLRALCGAAGATSCSCDDAGEGRAADEAPGQHEHGTPPTRHLPDMEQHTRVARGLAARYGLPLNEDIAS